MASTITLTSNKYGTADGNGEQRYLQLVCTQTKDIANNKSTIRWTLTSKGGKAYSYATGPTTVYINGVNVYERARYGYATEVFPNIKGSKSGTIDVFHDSNGAKSISVSLTTAIYENATNTKTSTWTLDSIPRKATLTSVPDFTDTDTPTIKYSNPAGNAVTSLEAYITTSNTSTVVVKHRSVSKTGTSYTFPFTDAERDALRNVTTGKSGEMNFILKTVIGGVSYWDIKPCTLTIKETTATKPSVTMNVALNNGSLPSKFDGLYIQNKSRVDVTLSAKGKYNASIKSMCAYIDGQKYTYSKSTITSNVITTDGAVDLEGYAEDSRGFSNIVTKVVNVISYSKPSINTLKEENAILCYRSDANGVRVRNSTSLWLKAKRIYSSVNGKNGCTLQYRYKLSTAENYSNSWKNLILTTDEYNAVIPDETFDAGKSYTVQIKAEDDIGEYDIKTFDIPTADVCFHLKAKGNGAAFGEYATEDYTLKLSDEWTADGLYGLGKCKQLTADDDANDCLEFRVYGVSAEIADEVENIPHVKTSEYDSEGNAIYEARAGILRVYSADGSGRRSGAYCYIMQEYITVTQNHYNRIIRTAKDPNKWIRSSWHTVDTN